MIIIIEGPDGSGKTTLANTIAHQTGYPVVHRSQPKNDEEKKQMMQSYIDTIKAGKNCIFDRCWYSEMVYGPVMRDASVISYPEMYELERMLAKRGALIIYCTDDYGVLWQRATKRGEDYVTSYATHEAICEGFDRLMNVPHLIPMVRYGYKDL
jgi:thymidylate kinase